MRSNFQKYLEFSGFFEFRSWNVRIFLYSKKQIETWKIAIIPSIFENLASLMSTNSRHEWGQIFKNTWNSRDFSSFDLEMFGFFIFKKTNWNLKNRQNSKYFWKSGLTYVYYGSRFFGGTSTWWFKEFSTSLCKTIIFYEKLRL